MGRRESSTGSGEGRQLALRVNILFFSIFLMFSVLILRLGYLQIVKGDDYVRELAQTEEISVNTSVPRGRIYDRFGHVLVENEPQNAITYTKTSSTMPKARRDKDGNIVGEPGMLEIAEELAKIIDKDTKQVTLGDKRDFWILLNEEAAAAKVSPEEQLKITEQMREKDEKVSDRDIQARINNLVRERITDEELNSLTDEQLKVLAIYREMMSGYAYSPQIVKSKDVTEEEFAIVSERLSELPGVNTTTDWDRVKRSKSAILGSTTSPIEGIPRSHLDYYMQRGYSRNDRVGRGYLEQQYEELLAGQKTVYKTIKDRTGEVVDTEVVHEGMPGKDLVLSVDRELELKLEQAVERKLRNLKAYGRSSKLDQAFVVMMDPNNGEVLALVGKQVIFDDQKGMDIIDYAYGTFTASYEMGSTVKMATVLTGYSEGVVQLGEVKIDEPLNVGGTRKRSLFNPTGRVAINDIGAIGRSSNVYMFRIAFSLGRGTYVPGRAMLIDERGFDRFRNGFAAFGLGVPTGVDLPNEVSGVKGPDLLAGKLMDFSIGQFDTYTPLQMAQYVSTIANGGNRIAPRMVKQIREPSPDGETLGDLIQETDIRVLNRVPNSEAEINQMKRGMEQVYYSSTGTANTLLEGAKYSAAGKTGTAETFKDGQGTISLSHVGYAPADNPEVAYAVVVPHVSTSYPAPPAANELVREALDIYFDLKAKRTKEGVEQVPNSKVLPPMESTK